MSALEHNKILGIGFATFAVIFAFTFLLLLVVSVAIFGWLGIFFANESGDNKNLVFGIAGAVLTILFYGLLVLLC